MKEYKIPMVPGPTSVPKKYRDVWNTDFGSADLEPEFFELYETVQKQLVRILKADGCTPVIQVGEGMLALWGALKSAVKPGERVLAIANGIFGHGIADMARQIGAEVEVFAFEFDVGIHDFERIRAVAERFRPALITAVHCETPSGLINNIAPLGEIAHSVGALLYVDFVSSAGGAELNVSQWGIDFGLLGSQKVLSLPPSLAVVTVSERGWTAVERVGYVGYDALLPWKRAVEARYFPYTFDWAMLEALHRACDAILSSPEGIEGVIQRHAEVAAHCRKQLLKMNVKLFVREHERNGSPTVTAAIVPDGWRWEDFDKALRAHGLVVGGSYGSLAGRVFRLGHMGSQATREIVDRALDVIAQVLKQGPPSQP